MTNRDAFNEYLREELRRQVAGLESKNNQRLVELLKERPEFQIRVDVGRELNYFMYTNLHGKPKHWKGTEDQVRWLDMEKGETWDD